MVLPTVVPQLQGAQLAAEGIIQLKLPPASWSTWRGSEQAGSRAISSSPRSWHHLLGQCFGSCPQCMVFRILVSPPWLCQVLLQQRLRMAVGSTGVCQLSPWPGRILAEHMGSAAPSQTPKAHLCCIPQELCLTEPGHGGCAQALQVTVAPPWQQERYWNHVS